MTVEEVLAVRSEQQSFHVVELATDLLRLCRNDAEVLRRSLLEPRWVSIRVQVQREVSDLVRDRGELDDDDAVQLRRIVTQQLAHEVPQVLLARATALGIDAGAGQFFAGWFHGRQLDLAPNDPFPIARNNVKGWVERTTGNPATRTEPLDRLPRLRLAPVDMRGLRISMHWADAALAELEHVTRFGLGVVSKPDVFDAYTWERYVVGGQDLFFHVRPREPSKFETRLRALLRTAEERGVGLLLLPELCFTAALHEEFVSSNAFRRLPFVAAGSFHSPAGTGPGHNEATFFAHGRVIGSHRKFRPVLFSDRFDNEGVGRSVTRQEHLQVEDSKITVLATGDWTVAVVICKDAMDNAVQDMLRELAVQLVLVPAMSPKAEDFVDLAQQLGRDPQSYTLIANSGETVAVVGTPAANNRVKTHKFSREGLLVFDRSGELIPE